MTNKTSTLDPMASMLALIDAIGQLDAIANAQTLARIEHAYKARQQALIDESQYIGVMCDQCRNRVVSIRLSEYDRRPVICYVCKPSLNRRAHK